MTRPIYASGMLRTAAKLSGRGAGRGRPALCDLRRATSTAYYALFHQISRHGALVSVPSADESEISFLARWFTHAGVKSASDLVLVAASGKQPTRPQRSAVDLLLSHRGGPVPSELIRVAQAFVDLQDARHAADYSNDYDPVRFVTVDHVNTADVAVKASWSMWRASWSPVSARQDLHDHYRRFLQLALLDSGGRKSR